MTFHFLNVGQGDCTIIQHPSGRVTMIDCSMARTPSPIAEMYRADAVQGHFHQKDHPENPIAYMRARNINDVFRFILTHPEMDHMDGIKDVFDAFSPTNFWDTANTRSAPPFPAGSNTRYREEDWKFYERLRSGSHNGSKRLMLHAGATGKFYNEDDALYSTGDNLHILAPTPALVRDANRTEDFNDASYVILYRTPAGRIIIAGDSHDATWEHIIANHRREVEDVELLIAPHHGRHSKRSFKFLDVVRPRVTLFGIAPSEDLAYGNWSSRGLTVVTNNQAGSVIVDTSGAQMHIFVTNETFARTFNSASGSATYYDARLKAWHLGWISLRTARAA